MKKLSLFFTVILITGTISAQWSPENFSSSTYYLACVYFLDENNGWISGGSNSEGNIYSTTDGGNNWTKYTFPDTEELESIFFIDELNGWAVGDKGIIIHTSNGGSDWFYQNSGTDSYLSSVFFVDNNKGWITYSTSSGTPPTDYVGHLLYTTDGGDNWTIQKEAEDYSFKDVFFIDADYGWIACYSFGNFSDIFLTTNGGSTWEKKDLNTVWSFFYKIHFVNRNVGWLVGESSIILKSTDGGNNWIVQHDFGAENLYSCFAVNENTAYAVGRKGNIFFTSNGGNDWEEQVSNTTQSLNSVFFIDENTGWTVGYSGTCLSTENGGVVGIETKEDLPKQFLLKQNYPNPFNPTTTIEYRIPFADPALSAGRRDLSRSSTSELKFALQVTLKVYDVLGRELSTLVNQPQPPGNYKIEFNAENLRSGIYYYKLSSGNYSDVKKMIILK